LVAGCSTELTSPESALNPAGPEARHIGNVTALFIVVCLVVFALVMITLAGAFIRHRRGPQEIIDEPVTAPEPAAERRLWWAVSGAVGVTVLTLFVLLFSDFATGRALQVSTRQPDPLRIDVIARQWWWEVRYSGWPDRFGDQWPAYMVTTANEIHIPVDPNNPVPVELRLDSADVIHSFWVPNLHGKRDIIPGHPTTLALQADRPGTYWGECAEYCGYQHAQMRLVVVAEPAEQFHSWLNAQRQEAPAPSGVGPAHGLNVFLGGTCSTCHTINGTDASGMVGPDLTHVAGRKILAAGAVPNAPGHLAGWILDPQRIKPGTRMPQNNLSPADLRALLEYLETLK
jgi:cytochrome c oxidase subunit 2